MDFTALMPLVETTTKLTVGALIAGFAYWSLSQRKPKVYERPNRRLEILEEVSASVGTVSHVFSKYSALAIESTRYGPRWPQTRRDELDIVNKELVHEFKKIADAEAKLLMLGEKALERTLRLYSARIAQFRREVYVGRRDINDKQTAELKAQVSEMREQFYDILSRKYDRLLAI